MKYKVGDKVTLTNGDTMTVYQINDTLKWYFMREDPLNCYTDEMIECKVEEETKPKFKVGNKITNGKTQLTILTITSDKYIVEGNFGECGTLYFNVQDDWKLVEEELQSKFKVGDVVYSRTWQRDVIIQEILPGGFYKVGDTQGLGWFIESEDNFRKEKITLPTDSHSKEVFKHKISLPEGYQFVDDGGNIINTNKIVLEKKKKEYPKTYEECAEIMNCPIAGPSGWLFNFDVNIKDPYYRKIDILMGKFTRLLICRDAYWKLYGDEMGLGKPWKPDWTNQELPKYCSANVGGQIKTSERYIVNTILAFPTEEMRDAFYENFKSKIEFCKELL